MQIKVKKKKLNKDIVKFAEKNLRLMILKHYNFFSKKWKLAHYGYKYGNILFVIIQPADNWDSPT